MAAFAEPDSTDLVSFALQKNLDPFLARQESKENAPFLGIPFGPFFLLHSFV
jgi:hypothetical protein